MYRTAPLTDRTFMETLASEIAEVFYKTSLENGTQDIVITGVSSPRGTHLLRGYPRDQFINLVLGPNPDMENVPEELRKSALETAPCESGCATWILFQEGSPRAPIQVSLMQLPPPPPAYCDA